MFSRFASWIRSVVSKMFGRSVYSKANLPSTIITDNMAAAIDRWVDLYYNKAPWLAKNSLSLGLPSSIAREIATLVTLEARVAVSSPEGGEAEDKLNPRAKFIRDSLKPLIKELPVRTEYACAFGGIVFKPYVDGEKVNINYVNADNFYPSTFNSNGDITAATFIETKKQGNTTYVRVESHDCKDNTCTITNKAYKSYSSDSIGHEVPLTDVAEWGSIQPEVTIANVSKPLFAYFKIPQGNVVDVESQLGVSVFSRADNAGVIEEADKQFQRLAWEYEAGEMAVDASSDAFKMVNNKPQLPVGKERLFRVNELDSKVAGAELLKTYAPALRDSSYAAGLNKLLMRVEDLCGLARGTYSDANEQARTATELKISKQRTYATVTTIQMALQKAIDELAEAIDTLATLYNLAPDGDYSISYVWDDSIVVDADIERQRDMQEVREGLMTKWEFRMKWYGETEEKAKAVLAEASSMEMTDDELMGFEG